MKETYEHTPTEVPCAGFEKAVGQDGQFAQAAPQQRRGSRDAELKAGDTRWGRQIIPEADNQLLNEFRTAAKLGPVINCCGTGVR